MNLFKSIVVVFLFVIPVLIISSKYPDKPPDSYESKSRTIKKENKTPRITFTVDFAFNEKASVLQDTVIISGEKAENKTFYY